jgi:glycosyltransferase involved in cell wall biosynthesis
MRVHIVDPSAFTPPYDHALCAALAGAGLDVELVTSRFAYGSIPVPAGYRRNERFYRHVPGSAGSRLRRVGKLVVHVPEMLGYRRQAARSADVVHFQWLDLQWLDRYLLPGLPTVLTAHDLLPREPRPLQARAHRALYDAVDAVVTHSEYGRRQLVDRLGLDPARVHVIPHGAFTHLVEGSEQELPEPLADPGGPVVLFFGLLRPYKGIETLLAAWRGIEEAELWVVGRPMMALEPLVAAAPEGVRFVPRFVSEGELAACFRRADLVVLPYGRTERFDQSGVLASALAFGKAVVLSDIGGFGEVAATGAGRLVPPGDAAALHGALAELLADPAARASMSAAAQAAAAGPYSWAAAAARTLELYEALLSGRRGR